MPFKNIDVSANARGGSELMRDRLIAGLKARGREDLLERFDFHNSRVRDFDSSRPSILLLHDLPGDPESEHLRQDGGERFKQLVFVSNWQFQQYQQYYGLNGTKCSIIPNAIERMDSTLLYRKGWKKPDRVRSAWTGAMRDSELLQEYRIAAGTFEDPIRLIYHTTPHRGLEILVPVFYELYEELKSEGLYIHLDVFSSFSIYGWSERDAPYKQIFQMCHEHPGITYHGAKPNSVVREALEKAHIFAFPSIWPETSCIAMIEAMASSTMVVHSNLAALVETSGGTTRCYPFIQNKDDHAAAFYDHLATAILDYRDGKAGFEMQRCQAVGEKHVVNTYVDQWITLLDRLK